MLPKVRKWLLSPSILGLIGILIVYNLFFAAYSLQKHAAFETAGFDLGNYEQTLWNTLHGNPMKLTTMDNITSNWSVHFEPILFLIVPIYAFFPSPHTLLLLQNFVVILGAVPIFLIARQKLYSDVAGLVFAVIFLLFPALQGALIFDFHAVVLAVTFLSFALWFLTIRSYPLSFLMLILAMGCKEDVALLVFMMGVYVLLIHRQVYWGAVIVITAGLWFLIVNFIVIPAVSPVGENIHLARYGLWGNSMGQVIINAVAHPLDVLGFIFSGDRLNYWLRAGMPVAFIALLDPFTLIIALPAMLINTLSAYPPTYQLDRYHSSAIIVPFVTVAAINGLAWLLKFTTPRLKHVKPGFLQNTLLIMMLLVTLIYQYQFGHTPIGHYYHWPLVTAHHRQAESMLAQIPPQAAVAAQNDLVPRLSQREYIFILPKVAHQGKPVDYIALDMQSSLVPYKYIEDYCRQLDQIVIDPHYGLIFAQDGLLLFKRGAPDTATFEPQPPCQ